MLNRIMEQFTIRTPLNLARSLSLKTLILFLTLLSWLMHPAHAATTHQPVKTSHAAKTSATARQSKTTKTVKTTSRQATKKTRLASSKTAQKKKTSTKRVAKKQSKKTNARKYAARSKSLKSAPKPSLAASRPVSRKHISKPSTQIETANVTRSHSPGYLLSSIEKNLVKFVRNTVAGIRYSAYKLGGTRIDENRGIYIVDCSSYVDHILKSIYPRAYSSLTSWSGSQKPTTQDFYQYFTSLSDDAKHWNTIEDVEELRPGDILVFRYKNRRGAETGGHVMIVMDTPTREGNTFKVRIADAASTGHSKDTRMPHSSGIGIGTMLLKVDSKTFQPYAYAWKVGSKWESNVNFAMARPIDLS